MSFRWIAILLRNVPEYCVDHNKIRYHGDHPHFSAVSKAILESATTDLFMKTNGLNHQPG